MAGTVVPPPEGERVVSGYAWNDLAVVPFASFVLRVLVNALVLKKNPRWIVSRIFFLLSIAVMFWDLGETFMALTDPSYGSSLGVTWARVEWLSVPMTAALTFQFAIACFRFYAKRPGLRWVDAIVYVPVLPFMYFTATTNEIIAGTTSGAGRPVAVRSDSLVNTAFTLYYTVLVFATIVLLWRARSRARDTRSKKELTWFFIAFFVPSMYATTFGLLIASYAGWEVVSFAIYDATLGLSAACLAYAIVRYQLFRVQVQILVRKALIVALSIALALAFLGGVAAVLLLVGGVGSLSSPLLLIAFLVIAVLFARRWERWATTIVETLLPALKWKETRIGDVFLVDSSGMLITRVSGHSDQEIDRDLLVGMLTVVQEFIRTSFVGEPRRGREGLNVLSYGKTRILLEHGDLCYLVVVFEGFEIDEMRPDIRRILAEIHVRYGSKLASWDGTPELGEAINPLLRTMLGRTARA